MLHPALSSGPYSQIFHSAGGAASFCLVAQRDLRLPAVDEEKWSVFVRKVRQVSLGQRFKPQGTAHPQLWEVEYAYVDAQGIPHTRLFEVRCPWTKRTVATATLLDPARYVQVPG